MKAVAIIPTPWTPYAVSFSPDGDFLAIGGGCWYGEGGLLLWNVRHGREECRWLWGEHGGIESWRRPLTVSGLVFSDDGRHLAASTWSASQMYGPTVLFACGGSQLEVRHSVNHLQPGDGRFLQRCTTGVLVRGPYLLTRHGADADVPAPVIVDTLPAALEVRATGDRQHLTHTGVVALGAHAVTGTFGRRMGRAAAPLAIQPIGSAGVELLQVDDCPIVTAITANFGGDGFVTGGRRGEVDVWSRNGAWRQTRRRAAQPEGRKPHEAVAWATYDPRSIVGLVWPHDFSDPLATNAAGELITAPGASEQVIPLGVEGSARSLAAHPARRWVAVGIKQGGWAKPPSTVVVVDLD